MHVLLVLVLVGWTLSMKLNTTFFLSFEVQSRITPTLKYYGEAHVDIEKSRVRFIAKEQNSKDTIYYDNGKMIKNGKCQHIAPPKVSLRTILQSSQLLGQESVFFDGLLSKENGEKWLVKYGSFFVMVVKENIPTKIISEHFVLRVFPPSRFFHEKRIDMPKEISLCEETKYRFSVGSSNSPPWFLNRNTCDKEWLKNHNTCLPSNDAEDQKDCVFIHGVGQDKTLPPQSSWSDYWGDVQKYVTAQCKSTLFIIQETQKRGWDDEGLQKTVCNYISDKDSVIRNKILYIHSMGNLIFGGALRSGFCKFDKSTSRYYDLSGPGKGSPVANFVVSACASSHWSSVWKNLADFFGYCGGPNTTAFHAYFTMKTDYGPLGDSMKNLQSIYSILDDVSSGQLCGTDAWGINSIDSVPLRALAEISLKSGTISDGMVPLNDCKTRTDVKFNNDDFHAQFYEAAINHADSTCRNGDGWYGNDRQPCSYVGSKR